VNLSFSTVSSLPDLSLKPSQGTVSNGSNAANNDGFAGLLRDMAGEALTTIREGEAAALSGISGGLPLQTVVERVMAAERTLQAALAVRDKAVSSYLEVSRMQI
jgi:flagellar hook-basal body complex protein FliE